MADKKNDELFSGLEKALSPKPKISPVRQYTDKHLSEIVKSISSGDQDKQEYLFKHILEMLRSKGYPVNPNSGRSMLSHSAGSFLTKETPELLKLSDEEILKQIGVDPNSVKISKDSPLSRNLGEIDLYDDKDIPSEIRLAHLSPEERAIVLAHEAAHKLDNKAGYNIPSVNKISATASEIMGNPIKVAQDVNLGHHKKGLFEKLILDGLIKSGKYKYMIPAVAGGALSLGAEAATEAFDAEPSGHEERTPVGDFERGLNQQDIEARNNRDIARDIANEERLQKVRQYSDLRNKLR